LKLKNENNIKISIYILIELTMPPSEAQKKATKLWRERNYEKYYNKILEYKRRHYEDNKDFYTIKNAQYRTYKKEFDYNYVAKIFRKILI
jgi:hypothetical protein